MAAVVVPLRRRNAPPSRAELVERLRALAKDSANMEFDHPHLQQRMKERGIAMRQVLEVVRKGDCVSGPTLDEYGDWRLKLTRMVAGRRVQAVVAIRESNFTVVTAI